MHRGGAEFVEFLIKRFSELCELYASVVSTSSLETRNSEMLSRLRKLLTAFLLDCTFFPYFAKIPMRRKMNFYDRPFRV